MAGMPGDAPQAGKSAAQAAVGPCCRQLGRPPLPLPPSCSHLMSGMPGSFGVRRRGRGGELGLDAHAAAEGGGGGGSDLDLDLAEEVTPLGR